MAQGTPGLTLKVGGFYEADDAGGAGKITHIAGSGQDSVQDLAFYNDTTWVNPFTGTAGNDWNNPTFPVQVSPALQEITTGAAPDGAGGLDCLTWAAVVYRTPVNDDDEDGLLNSWETSPTAVVDPFGRALPLLSRMGADPNVKDIFIEVNYLTTGSTAYTYGGVAEPAHSHQPAPEALRLFGDTFKARGINVHFDVGPDYDVGSETAAEPYIIRDTVPGLARGGESFDESITVCEPPAGSAPWVCQFSTYPGTIGWKSGLRGLRDAITVQPEHPDGTPLDCEIPGNTTAAGQACEFNFDPTRRDMFRYALFAHFIGLPTSTRPCLDAALNPIEDVNGQCPAGATPNPDFHVPRTYSGVGDFPGADLIVSLGGFKDTAGHPIGTPFMQASTLAHEFGHTVERRHGGEPFEPNCKPAYLSVMNYLYQLRGLLDDDGKPHLDFSEGTPFADVDESAVQEGVFSASPFRLGWYAPLDFSYLKDQRPPAKSHCDGSPLLPGERYVRIDAHSSAAPIDWNANDAIDAGVFAQDVNFNGRVNGTGANASSGPLKGFSDDWGNLKLNQVGSRRNVGGLYRTGNGVLSVGALSLDVGKVDLGPSDLGKVDLEFGKVDLGKVDLGKVDLGKVDLSLGKVDLGKVDLGKVDLDLGAAQEGSGDIGRGDFGGGDLFTNDPENPLGEIDAIVAAELARTPPNEFRACVAGPNCVADGAGANDIVARFTAPNIGGVLNYRLYRVEGDTLSPGLPWTLVATVPADAAKPQGEDYVVIDGAELVDQQTYTYFAVARYGADDFQDGIDSDPSNLATITAINAPLVAGADVYTTGEDTPLTVPAPGVLANDGDQDTPVDLSATVVAGPAHGTLMLAADGSFTYAPTANFSGTDGFTYRPVAGSPVIGSVTVTVQAVNDGPTISLIADQTIPQNTVLGPLGITVGDAEDVGAVTLSATVINPSNPALLPGGSIVFGGSGATRTITVMPAAGQAGTATIRITPVDGNGLAGTPASFLLTVDARPQAGIYAFVNLKNAPPPAGTKFKAGSSIPLQWRYQDASGVAVDSSHLQLVVGLSGPTTINYTNTGAGSSAFQYDAASRQWAFTLQTKDALGKPFKVGTYQVTVGAMNDGRFATRRFTLVLVK
jgi:hypothetical protein